MTSPSSADAGRAFLRQAIAEGFFHADMHQGNLFALPGNKIAAIDFGIMGRIDRRARVWLAEILYGLITGNYKRVAEIHFEAGYVPAHHNVAEFATALRAVGEPMRGLPVKDMSIGMMLDGLFSITRDFDMVTQPHLLLLQKTMVMVEGVATSLDPDINLWDSAAVCSRMDSHRTRPRGQDRRPADRGCADARPPARTGPPYRGALPRAGWRAARPAAQADRGRADRWRLALCADLDAVGRRRGRGHLRRASVGCWVGMPGSAPPVPRAACRGRSG